jgi:two-component system, sensor histidine kinase
METLFRTKCQKKGIQFEVVRFDPLPPQIITDPNRLKQILINVLTNAVKFTSVGNVRMEIRSTDKMLRFIISDTGIGIPQAEFPNLFQPFSQLNLSMKNPTGGTGLGLALSRRLAELLGGNVFLRDSSPGIGSSFEVVVQQEEPVGESADESRKSDGPLLSVEESKQLLKGRKILVVDDAADNQLLIKLMLSKFGVQVSLADNGAEGVDLATQEKFDLILMDLQMPIMDGYAATRELRKRGNSVPIVALTAHVMKSYLDACKTAGCSDVLTKPIDQDTLLKTVARHVVQS